MRRLAAFVGALAFFAVSLSAGEFELRFQEVDSPEHPVFSLLSSRSLRLRQRPAGTTLPESSGQDPWYYQVLLGLERLHAMMTPSERTLYIDAGDGFRLLDEQPLSGTPVRWSTEWGTRRALLFGPLSMRKEGREVNVRVIVSESGHMEVFPEGFVTGDITLSGETYRVAIADANFNGRYDGIFDADGPSDTFVIDLNRDGEISPYHQWDGEIAPLGRFISVEGQYYALRPAPDGSSIRVERAEPEMGTVDSDLPGGFMAFWSDSGAHYVEFGNGPLHLPSGIYQPLLLGLTAHDNRGQWSITANDTGSLTTFTIEPGRNIEVKFGPPLVATLDPSRHGDAITTGLSIVGRAGESYPVSAELDGRALATPSVEVFLEDGSRTAHGRFEYG